MIRQLHMPPSSGSIIVGKKPDWIEKAADKTISDWLSYMSEYNIPTTQEDIDTTRKVVVQGLISAEEHFLAKIEDKKTVDRIYNEMLNENYDFKDLDAVFEFVGRIRENLKKQLGK